MSNVSEFVAAAEQADPALTGSNDKDKAQIAKLVGETEGYVKDLSALNEKLTPLTYLYSNSPSSADVSLYAHLHPTLISAPSSQHPQQPSLLRYFLQIQSLESVQSAQKSLPNSFPSLDIDLSTLSTPERKAPPPKVKKDKKPAAPAATAGSVTETVTGAVSSALASATAAASSVSETAVNAATAVKEAVVGGAASEGVQNKDGKKKEKKEKKEKIAKAPQPAKEEPTGPLPSMIDMRVGKVLDVKRHPDADSLYVESIDVGEEEPRTVCSGLVKYMSEDDIRGATIVVICNLKPVTMRGVKSFAMLLCASSKDGKDEGGIEFVYPPEGSQPGERIYFEGEKYENAKPEAQLNPKKKIFETIQPGFITLDTKEAAWIDPETKSVHKIRTKDGVLKTRNLIGASLS